MKSKLLVLGINLSVAVVLGTILTLWCVFTVSYPVMIADTFYDPDTRLGQQAAWSAWANEEASAAPVKSVRHGKLTMNFHVFQLVQTAPNQAIAARGEIGVKSFSVRWFRLILAALATIVPTVLAARFLRRYVR